MNQKLDLKEAKNFKLKRNKNRQSSVFLAGAYVPSQGSTVLALVYKECTLPAPGGGRKKKIGKNG